MSRRREGLLALLPDDDHADQLIAAYELVQTVTGRLRDLRKLAGLSQSQLADRLGLTQGRISQIESGLMDHAPSLEMTARYAEACGFRMTPMFTPTSEPNAKEPLFSQVALIEEDPFGHADELAPPVFPDEIVLTIEIAEPADGLLRVGQVDDVVEAHPLDPLLEKD